MLKAPLLLALTLIAAPALAQGGDPSPKPSEAPKKEPGR